MRINTICPDYISSLGGPSYACQALLGAMNAAGIDVSLYCVSSANSVHRSFYRLSIPLWAKPVGYRLFTEECLRRYTERRYLSSLESQDLAYVWPGTSLETYRAIKSSGHILITENVNTHQATSKEILDEEWHRLGLTPGHGINEKSIADENEKLELIDYVFSPSIEVTRSLIRAAVPREAIIQSSYGCNENNILLPEEIAGRGSRTELTAIFVGRIGIRKGVHLLLDYWVKAGVTGKLKLVGRIEPSAMHLIEPYLNKQDIEHIPFTRDLRSVYLDADVFLLPSLEEGSPLVTYLALGAGLPSIVSPMGGGGIINNGHEGLVIDPHDADQWIESIRKVFSDTGYRLSIANHAYRLAGHYLWKNVGRRRAGSLLESIANNVNLKSR